MERFFPGFRSKLYKCPHCGREFQEESKYEKHMEVHDEKRRCFLCDTCGKGFVTGARLKKHALVHSEDRPISCSLCDKRFKEGGALSRHMRSRHTDERPYKCPICGDKFTVAGILKVHMRTHTGERPYECMTCGDRFTISGALKAHMRTHTGERPYSCKHCTKKFINIGHLRNHMKCHTNEQTHVCDTCHKSYHRAESLAAHVKLHNNERPFPCIYCNKAFRSNGDLTKHVRIHTGEKPYVCTVCDKSFRQVGGLQIHMRVHSKVKPYECTFCGKAFTQGGSLKIHVRIHTGERPYTCLRCEATFRERSGLRKHICSATQVLPYFCTTCNKQFDNLVSLMRHRTTHRRELGYVNPLSKPATEGPYPASRFVTQYPYPYEENMDAYEMSDYQENYFRTSTDEENLASTSDSSMNPPSEVTKQKSDQYGGTIQMETTQQMDITSTPVSVASFSSLDCMNGKDIPPASASVTSSSSLDGVNGKDQGLQHYPGKYTHVNQLSMYPDTSNGRALFGGMAHVDPLQAVLQPTISKQPTDCSGGGIVTTSLPQYCVSSNTSETNTRALISNMAEIPSITSDRSGGAFIGNMAEGPSISSDKCGGAFIANMAEVPSITSDRSPGAFIANMADVPSITSDKCGEPFIANMAEAPSIPPVQAGNSMINEYAQNNISQCEGNVEQGNIITIAPIVSEDLKPEPPFTESPTVGEDDNLPNLPNPLPPPPLLICTCKTHTDNPHVQVAESAVDLSQSKQINDSGFNGSEITQSDAHGSVEAVSSASEYLLEDNFCGDDFALDLSKQEGQVLNSQSDSLQFTCNSNDTGARYEFDLGRVHRSTSISESQCSSNSTNTGAVIGEAFIYTLEEDDPAYLNLINPDRSVSSLSVNSHSSNSSSYEFFAEQPLDLRLQKETQHLTCTCSMKNLNCEPPIGKQLLDLFA